MLGADRPHTDRTFVYRAGIRIAHTVVACDASGGSDLLFVSDARAAAFALADEGALDAAAAARPPARTLRPGRAQVLTTAETLALLGRDGARLAGRALSVGFGRPFTLGAARVELLPAGHLPGGAALYCESGGRRILYAGGARLGAPTLGATAAAVREADALCLDATFGHPRFAFAARDEAAAEAARFAADARAAGAAAIVLAPPLGPALEIGAALVAAGWRLRGHRAIVAAAAAYRSAGVAGTPAVARWDGALARDEALLWPPAERAAGRLGRLGPARALWISGYAADARAAAEVRADRAIAYSNLPDFAALVAYAAATGAREIAACRGFTEELARALAERGADAYALGPPRQIQLRL